MDNNYTSHHNCVAVKPVSIHHITDVTTTLLNDVIDKYCLDRNCLHVVSHLSLKDSISQVISTSMSSSLSAAAVATTTTTTTTSDCVFRWLE